MKDQGARQECKEGSEVTGRIWVEEGVVRAETRHVACVGRGTESCNGCLHLDKPVTSIGKCELREY